MKSNDLQNTTRKINDPATPSPLQTGKEIRCSVRVSSSCATCDTRRFTHVMNREIHLMSQSLLLVRIRVMTVNDTFNNISVISWWSILLMEETGVPRENYRPAGNGKFYHIMLYRVYPTMNKILTHNWL
jgi:hypothetical protein